MTVELVDHMGDDLRITNSAKVSFHKQSVSFGVVEQAIVRSMLTNGHGSPFEHVVFTFCVRVPIGVAREWQRHRAGSSFNEESTRYVEMRDDFYIPEMDAVRRQVGKAMQYSFEPMSNIDSLETLQAMTIAYRASYDAYQNLLKAGVAKELARNVLPLGLLTEFYWTVNLRSLFNFLMLRNAPPALLEIRREAQEVERLVTEVLPFTMEAWNEVGRPKV